MGEYQSTHQPCPECGSRDALTVYAAGDSRCFSCGHYSKSSEGNLRERKTTNQSFLKGQSEALSDRGISQATCEKWQYRVRREGTNVIHIANYRDGLGQLVSQKIRKPGKQFSVAGRGKDMPLYGQWLWRDGKHIVITEGEIDALSMSQAMDNKWPVVSLPNGAQSAAKAIGRALDYLLKFENIVLCFDMDKPGRAAVEEVAKVLPPGRVKVMTLPRKDANDVLVKMGPQELVKSFWAARDWRPDGIVAGSEITVAKLKEAVCKGFEMPYPKLQESVMGLRKGEITLLTAGTGIGKSTWARELAYLLATQYGCKIGNVFLEESNTKTAQAYVAIHNNIALKNVRADPNIISDGAWEQGLREVVHGRMWFYDHFGSLGSQQLLTKLRYLAAVVRCDFAVLDHISIVVSGVESSQGERKDIDVLMTHLRSLVEETGMGIIAIVHLNQPEGTPHEEGGRVTLRNLRGSGGLKQLSDNVYALERDQQGENPTYSLIRVLKCRETGETGEADWLNYNKQTGRLLVSAPPPLEDQPFEPAPGEVNEQEGVAF